MRLLTLGILKSALVLCLALPSVGFADDDEKEKSKSGCLKALAYFGVGFGGLATALGFFMDSRGFLKEVIAGEQPPAAVAKEHGGGGPAPTPEERQRAEMIPAFLAPLAQAEVRGAMAGQLRRSVPSLGTWRNERIIKERLAFLDDAAANRAAFETAFREEQNTNPAGARARDASFYQGVYRRFLRARLGEKDLLRPGGELSLGNDILLMLESKARGGR